MKRSKILITLLVLVTAVAVIVAAYLVFLKPDNGDIVYDEEVKFLPNTSSVKFGTSDGAYYENDESFLMFYDLKTEQSVLVCNKPNCTHEEWDSSTPEAERCDAYLSFYNNTMFEYGGKLYYIGLTEGDERYETNLKIICSELDRSGQYSFAEIKDVSYFGDMVICDGKLYVMTSAVEMSMTDEGETAVDRKSASSMYSVDISTGEVKLLFDPIEEYNLEVIIQGAYNDKIYMVNSYAETPYDGTNFDEANFVSDWLVYDTETGELSELAWTEKPDIHMASYGSVIGNKLLYYVRENTREAENIETDIFELDLDSGNCREVMTIRDGFPTFFDGKMFYSESVGEEKINYCYDPSTGKTKEKSGDTIEGRFSFVDCGEYVFKIVDEDDGTKSPYIIYKDDFYK